jgi:nucleoside-diphosphate kinase
MFSAATRSLASTASRRVATRSSTGVRAVSSVAARSAAAAAPITLAIVASTAVATAAAYSFDSTVKCDKVPVYGVPGTNRERTFLAVKPDGVQRGLVGEM